MELQLITIHTEGNKLTVPSTLVEELTDNVKGLANAMIPKMHQEDGVGLAAPQVGHNIRLIVVLIEGEVMVMINPNITHTSFRKEFGEEGCLSVPGIAGKVKRAVRITVVYKDLDGRMRKLRLQDLNARIIQHEVDHLDGILFNTKAKGLHPIIRDEK